MKPMYNLIILCVVSLLLSPKAIVAQPNTNTIKFETSEYGLIFTTISVNEHDIKAMIDFGDQHILQLSSHIISDLKLETETAGYKVSDVYGNTWDVNKGTVKTLTVGSWKEIDVEFTSQEGEMEAVSEQIGTTFNAVIGWGYFKRYFTEINYTNSQFIIHKNKNSLPKSDFSIPFQNDANQLIITAVVANKNVNLMIDTGSPVTVIDSTFSQSLTSELFSFTLDGHQFKLPYFSQDLSVLADLEVVGILGGDFLDDLNIIINPNDQLLYFGYNLKKN